MPHLPPVDRIELSTGHVRLRIVAVVLLLLIGAGALAYAFTQLVSGDDGWQEIEAGAAGLSCAQDFTLLYDVGAGEASASAEKRALSALYGAAAVRAYQMFDVDQSWEGVVNLHDLNARPNEELEVDGALYDAFALLERYDSRALYLAPVYEVYENLFLCQEDAQAAQMDPFADGEMADYVSQAAAFAADPESIDLELLGENRVRLRVSRAYLDWAADSGATRLVDFYWLKNAFIADYLAQALTDAGYTHGALSSYDGFVRCLDSREMSYSFNLFDRADMSVYPAAVMDYAGPMSLVSLRDYPLGDRDSPRYYQWSDGALRFPYVDADGLCRAALPELTAYSPEMGCAETLLNIVPLYVGEDFSPAAAERLAGEGISCVWFDRFVLYATDPDLTVSRLYDQDGVRYTTAE